MSNRRLLLDKSSGISRRPRQTAPTFSTGPVVFWRVPETPSVAYRFTMVRGDSVEAFFSTDLRDVATVLGISRARQKVRVRLCDGSDGR
jgi:hypothetical protein